MNILLMTNTYTPMIGGLERSIIAFKQEYQQRGHRVVVVAPRCPQMPPREQDVIRIPALQSFNGSDFSVKLPIPPALTHALLEFHPDLIHAQHPFLIGDTALRLARAQKVPLVFTHHTLFEQYTHYTPIDSPLMQRFVIELSTGYANLCDAVFAPSESVAVLLKARGVQTPIMIVPTGVELRQFARGNRRRGRAACHIPEAALVIGQVGRLAPEKNLRFLSQAIARVLAQEPRAHFLVAGTGPSAPEMRAIFAASGVASRVHLVGVLQGQALSDAYHAMDVFAFASHSETQGLVLVEAMAARVPVAAVDAPGVREVVDHQRNGVLLRRDDAEAFAAAVRGLLTCTPARRRAFQQAAWETAKRFAMSDCAERALAVYQAVIAKGVVTRGFSGNPLMMAMRRLQTEWELLSAVTKATGAAVAPAPPPAREWPALTEEVRRS